MSLDTNDSDRYQVVMRHRVERYDLYRWREYDGAWMTEELARRLIDGMTPMLPGLSKPECAFELIAEPVGAVA